jgi:DNA repair exonuclease SbcCD nuclease subunit
MLRLIHTADWQLGKPYGRFDSDVRAALSEARFDAIDAIGKAAAEHAGMCWSLAMCSIPKTA